MVKILSWLHSTFKEISNEYSHAQIRVKMKKLWPRQVGEEKQVAVQKLSRDQEIVSRPGNLVATTKPCMRKYRFQNKSFLFSKTHYRVSVKILDYPPSRIS